MTITWFVVELLFPATCITHIKKAQLIATYFNDSIKLIIDNWLVVNIPN